VIAINEPPNLVAPETIARIAQVYVHQHSPTIELVQEFHGGRQVGHYRVHRIGVRVQRLHDVLMELRPQLALPIQQETHQYNPGQTKCDGAPGDAMQCWSIFRA
jgi:hypothetical protein